MSTKKSPDIIATQIPTAMTVTSSAVAKVAELIQEEGNLQLKLRVDREGGGCSGFQYKFDLVRDQADDDLVIEKAGVIILIDSISPGFLGGSEIDFVDDGIGASFQIKNPNAVAACGCGTSFSL